MGLVLSSFTLECLKIKYALKLGYKASNNEAEYEMFLAGLSLARVVGTRDLDIFNDSQLVV